MNNDDLPSIEGCPFTHLLAASRFAKPSKYVVGPMGVEFSALPYIESVKTFEIKPVFDFGNSPWDQTRCERIVNGIWLVHPEHFQAGIGLFAFENHAKESAAHMKLKGHKMFIAKLGMSFKYFLDPLWKSVDLMEESFWANQNIEHEEIRFKFEKGLQILRAIQSAKVLIGLARMRENHPYW